jgi:TolB protein
MNKKIEFLLSYFAVFFIIFFIKSSVYAENNYEYINISNPFLAKIPIAIAPFKDISNNDKGNIITLNNGMDYLIEMLRFTGYFNILDKDAFLADFKKSGIISSSINFRQFTTVGAELLITGGEKKIKNGKIFIELRLFDTFKEKMLLGKQYEGQFSDRKRIIRRFAGDVIYYLTGKKGVFETKIVFESKISGKKNIFICDFDGKNPRRITKNNSINLSPSWSTDSKWIAYTSYNKGKPDLYIRNIKAKRGAIVSFDGANISPAWVPGKFMLAASLSFSGDSDIYLLTGNGKIIKKLTTKWGIDVSPSFSPDGKKMAFVSRRSGTPQIYIKNLYSGNVKRLTYKGRYNTNPSWSPRGDKIAYSAMTKNDIDICTIDIDGKNVLKLTSDAADNESPSWSPDGSLIVFSSNRSGTYRIYVMTSFGTDQRILFTMKGAQTNPEWSKNIVHY